MQTKPNLSKIYFSSFNVIMGSDMELSHLENQEFGLSLSPPTNTVCRCSVSPWLLSPSALWSTRDINMLFPWLVHKQNLMPWVGELFFLAIIKRTVILNAFPVDIYPQNSYKINLLYKNMLWLFLLGHSYVICHLSMSCKKLPSGFGET